MASKGQREPPYRCKEGRVERLSIPIHRNQTLKTGLQRALMKIIPIEEADL